MIQILDNRPHTVHYSTVSTEKSAVQTDNTQPVRVILYGLPTNKTKLPNGYQKLRGKTTAAPTRINLSTTTSLYRSSCRFESAPADIENVGFLPIQNQKVTKLAKHHTQKQISPSLLRSSKITRTVCVCVTDERYDSFLE